MEGPKKMVWPVHCGRGLSLWQPKPGFGFLFLAILAATGCRSNPPHPPQVVPVSGVVTLDGKPLAGAAITFEPVAGGVFGCGSTNEKGEFTLGTFAETDGALVGVHRISIVPDIISPAAMGQTPGGEEGMDRRGESSRGAKSRIPEKYASIDTSGLQVDVQKGMPPVTFELTKN
jgi:hypothetical protein